MVGSRYPFRDPNRRPDRPDRDDPQSGNRPERDPNRRDDGPSGYRTERDPNRRDDQSGSRAERDPNRREDTSSGNRPDRGRDAMSGSRRPRTDRPRDDGGDSPPAPSAPQSAGAVELASLAPEIEAMIRLMASGDLSELQIESGGVKILLRRGNEATSPPVGSPPPPSPAAAPPSPTPEPAAAPASSGLPAMPGHSPAATPALTTGEHFISSPMVGTFYAASEPTAPPYVLDGDAVAVGQVVGIIEAMKMYNPIESELAGRVARILVRDGQGVEYGQPLMVIAEG
ncbi:MAG: acetyl-CoA carboxylase biotin carboxyl carrier protein [Chloroflexia bacterium]